LSSEVGRDKWQLLLAQSDEASVSVRFMQAFYGQRLKDDAPELERLFRQPIVRPWQF